VHRFGGGDTQFPGQQFLHALAIGDSVFQRSWVGCWLEGLWNSTAGALYFEENGFRDIQYGAGTDRQSVGLQIQSLLTSSQVNGRLQGMPNYSDASILYTLPVANVNLPAPHDRAMSIDVWSGVSLNIENGIMAQVFPGGSGSKKLIATDGASGNCTFGFDRYSSVDPFDFADQSRVLVEQNGFPRFGINSLQPYWSHSIAWHNLNTARPAFHDPTIAGGVEPLAFMSYLNFIPAVSRPGLWIGAKKGATSEEGSVLYLSGHSVAIGNTERTRAFVQVKTGTEHGPQQGHVEILPSASAVVSGDLVINKRRLSDYAAVELAIIVIERVPTAAELSAIGNPPNRVYKHFDGTRWLLAIS
jgi:hypothetical protein